MLSEKPWRYDSTLLLGVRIFICWFAGQLLASLVSHASGAAAGDQLGLPIVIVTLMGDGLALVWIALMLREYALGWAEAFGFKNHWPRAVALGVATAVVLVPCTLAIHYACVSWLTRLHFQLEDQLAVQILLQAHSASKIAYMGFATILLAPVAEELVFRGICYPQLKNLGYPRLAIWVVSAFFALAHMNLAAFVPLFFLAVMLTLLYEWTDNLLACIVVHSLFNAANFVALFVLRSSGQLSGN